MSEPDPRLAAVLEGTDLLQRLAEPEFSIDNSTVEAMAAFNRGDYSVALKACAVILSHDPRNWLGWYGAGVSAARLREHTIAIDLLTYALAMEPKPAPAAAAEVEAQLRYNLGRILQIEGYLHVALRHYERSVELDPRQCSTWGNLGNLWLELGKPFKAMRCYGRAVALEPGSPVARFNRAFAALVCGDFAQGLADHEARWESAEHLSRHARPDITTPRWDGSTTPDTVLVHAEQGRGDQIQMMRYLPTVERRVGHLIVETFPELISLCAHSFPGLDFITHVEPHDPATIPPHDAHVPIMSLMYVLGERLEAVRGDPYLVPPPGGPLLPPAAGLRVGIAWAGSPLHMDDRKRSTNLADWAPLLRIPGVSWVSLQVGEQEDDGLVSVSVPIQRSRDLGIATFADAASVISQLDLVICVDTATAHLAGALGVPVWILLPVSPDWRWQLEREDSPWYASARLFRATKPFQWQDVMKRLASALRNLIIERERVAA
jgi:Flp pilus assembly protein TadD